MIGTFEKAFQKGFEYVFDKGTFIIEKSYNIDKLKDEAEINEYILSKRKNKKNIKRFDKSANKSSLINTGIVGIEGAALGVLGIGLPDIPVFIGMILKNIYEISLKYGFDYEKNEEKVFILNLICLAVCSVDDREKYSKRLDEISRDINNEIKIKYELDEMIKETSENLSKTMLVSKFIQGIPLVGAVGGITNIAILNKVSKVSKIKYKKRMLYKM